jgi:hypothetical protein
MEKLVFFSFVICVFFLVFKFLEMKYIEQEYKPAKTIIRDMIIVFVSSFLGIFFYNKGGGTFGRFFDVITDKKTLTGGNVNVFTDNPNF